LLRPPPTSTLFPYTTLFRSLSPPPGPEHLGQGCAARGGRRRATAGVGDRAAHERRARRHDRLPAVEGLFTSRFRHGSRPVRGPDGDRSQSPDSLIGVSFPIVAADSQTREPAAVICTFQQVAGHTGLA